MKINAKVTILFDHDGLAIHVYDSDASIRFLEIRLDQEQACQALSRLGNTHTDKAEVFGLDRVGKVMEYRPFELKVADEPLYGGYKETAELVVDNVCPKGWVADTSFNSRNSFFEKDGQQWARTIIRRWVDKEVNHEVDE